MTSVNPDQALVTSVEKSDEPAPTHETIVLSGCMIHSPIDEAGLGWISQTLRCVQDIDEPPAGTFDTVNMILQVVTFDDIDTCTRIATKTLSLSPIASIGIRELLVNAVEHGNLGITFEEKSELLKFGRWQEEIETRLSSEENRGKFAAVELRRNNGSFAVTIRDQGAGFDWQGYLESEERPSTLLHGRGVDLAMNAGFETVEYRGTGNEVCLSGACDLG